MTKPSLKTTPLWSHQVDAVNSIRKYLKAWELDNAIGSALIHMPTGTGKTGVIASASHFLKKSGCVLILCPRIALRDQLCREVKGRFFTKLTLTDELPKAVYNVKKGFPSIDAGAYKNAIIVMTIQKLYSYKKKHTADPENHKEYEILQSKVNLLIVDEGHYEPALMWSDAIRGIKAPKLIFTATPFRNDLKLFDISFDFSFSYTFKKAKEDKVIREVQFHSRQKKDNPSEFVNDVLAFYENKFGDQLGLESQPRVIIRCDSQAEIRQIGIALQNAGQSYVLIHENFSDNGGGIHERRTVPDPNEETAVFWVHQFKLLEGIDDQRFQLLAMFNEFGNAREIVQQVGRVIRNPNREDNAVGYVLDHSDEKQKELWDGFVKFDELVESEGIQVADFGKKLLQEIKKAIPEIVYMDRRFRRSFDLEYINPNDDIELPTTVNIYRKSGGFNIDELLKTIENEYRQQDREIKRFSVDGAEVIIYLSFRNSPFLKSSVFVECKLGVTVIKEYGQYVCYFDSSGSISDNAGKDLFSIEIDELKQLFEKSANTHLTSVSLLNSNIGSRSIRSRSYSAARIDDTVPSFDDHAFVCKTARGYTGKSDDIVRRYIGFQRGRVSDSTKGGRLPFPAYFEWLKGITSVLGSDVDSINDFSRFASNSVVPDDPRPLSLLLDVVEVEEMFKTNAVEGVPAGQLLYLEDACCTVDNSGKFTVTANGKKCTGEVAFDSKSSKYHIKSADLEKMYYASESNLQNGLVRYLNYHQSFRVIPKSEGAFYTLGNFYAPFIKFGRSYNDDQIGLLKVIYPYETLNTVGNEKGFACAADGSGWDVNSLFSIIDLLGVGHGLEDIFGTPDIVVCDDMGTEAADFILADTDNNKVVFIHAKGSKNLRKYAASPLQEVCGQAVKNLKYLAKYGADEPPKARKWHTDEWKSSNTTTGKVKSHIRKSPDGVRTGLDAWKAIHKIIRHPNAELEVWLFLGKILSKSALEKQLRSRNPKAEAKQSAFLLFSTLNSAASIGAKLKVVSST